MVLSASSPSALAESGNSYSYVKTQAQAAVMGLFAMYIISKVDYKSYKKLYKLAYIASVVLLALVPLIGEEINGAKRWIIIGSIQIQPSELAKVGLIIFYAGYLSNNKEKIKSLWHGFGKPFILLAIPVLILVVFQDHLSASIVIIAITAVMMLIAGTRMLYFIIFGGTAGIAGISGLYLMAQLTDKGSFRFERIISFLDPWAEAQGDGWQIIQSLYAIGSGGLFGAGLRTK